MENKILKFRFYATYNDIFSWNFKYFPIFFTFQGCLLPAGAVCYFSPSTAIVNSIFSPTTTYEFSLNRRVWSTRTSPTTLRTLDETLVSFKRYFDRSQFQLFQAVEFYPNSRSDFKFRSSFPVQDRLHLYLFFWLTPTHSHSLSEIRFLKNDN